MVAAAVAHISQTLVVALLLLAAVAVGFGRVIASGRGGQSCLMSDGFYNATCPRAESIVREAVEEGMAADPKVAAGLIRLHFHDCFVAGCDASILLDTTPTGEAVEKDSPANSNTLRGLDVVDEAKLRLEGECPGVVSCADVLAFAARDAAVLSGIPFYAIPSGRRDGRASLASNVPGNLPSPFSTVDEQAAVFDRKGFTVKEMVTLLGAHSIGSAHCPSFDGRLYPASNSTQDLDATYADYLMLRCPPPPKGAARRGPRLINEMSPAVSLNPFSQTVLDNSYYAALLANKGLLSSDQALADDDRTRRVVKYMAANPGVWAHRFGQAMHKLGKVGVLEGHSGEVRRSCRTVN